MTDSPLTSLHQRHGAILRPMWGWTMPAHYGDPAAEYRAISQGAALVDRSPYGRIRAWGKDALDLLNRLSTNKLEELLPGAGAGTVLTTNKGRVIDLLGVVATGDHLLLLTSPTQRHRVIEWVEFYTFAEEVRLEDVTDKTASIAIAGLLAPQVVRRIMGKAPDSLFHCAPVAVAGFDGLLVRTDRSGVPEWELLVEASQAQAAWQWLLAAGEPWGLRPVGYDALEMARVEQGVPHYGTELSEEHNPLEARLWVFVSYTKGCYVGQEVVARLTTYKKVQRQLMSVALEGPAAAGEELLADGQPVGTVTSVVQVPEKGWRALAYVKAASAQPGVRVTAAGSGAVGVLNHPPFALATEPVEVR